MARFDRPGRTKQKDLQKYWINHPPHFEWMKIDDPETRFDAVLAVVNEGNGPGGSVQTHRDGYVAWTPEALAAVQAAAAGS